MLANGVSYTEITRTTGCSSATVAQWKERFLKDRLAGLKGRHQGSKPRGLTARLEARRVAHAQVSSWLNQVELWFSKVDRDVIARGIFTSTADLARKLRRYIEQYNKSATPFRWSYADPKKRIA